MNRSSTPIVHFYRLIDEARLPQRADRSAAGTLPTRAYRYCEAVTAATGFGWWVFPPTDLQFLWDGHDIFWQCTGWQDWLPLMPAAQFPDFASRFDEAAPASLAGCSPPFLSALPEPGTLQIWTGLMARTAPDWSLLIRAPANLPLPGGYHHVRGDRGIRPLVRPVVHQSAFHAHQCAGTPAGRLSACPGPTIATRGLCRFDPRRHRYDRRMAGLSEHDWANYQDTIAMPNDDPDRSFGGYATAARKRSRAAARSRRQPLKRRSGRHQPHAATLSARAKQEIDHGADAGQLRPFDDR